MKKAKRASPGEIDVNAIPAEVRGIVKRQYAEWSRRERTRAALENAAAFTPGERKQIAQAFDQLLAKLGIGEEAATIRSVFAARSARVRRVLHAGLRGTLRRKRG